MNTDTTPAPPAAGHAADDGHDHEHAHGSNSYAEVLLAGLAGLLLLAGWLVERSVGEGARAAWMLYLGAYAAGGFFAVREAWENLRARKLQIDA